MREANERGEAFGLTEDEIAFYDALETNDGAVKVLGDKTLQTIVRELVVTSLFEGQFVNRCVARKTYPALPDKLEKATQTVLMQAEVLSQEWGAVE